MAATGARRIAGGVEVRLDRQEVEVLRTLPGALLPVLRGESSPDVAARLFPTASDDPDVERSYRELVGDDLVDHHVTAVQRFAETLDAGRVERRSWVVRLDDDDAHAWLSTVNDLRLVLAPFAGIDSEERWEAGPDPNRPESLLLYHLSWLQEELLDALMASLPPGADHD